MKVRCSGCGKKNEESNFIYVLRIRRYGKHYLCSINCIRAFLDKLEELKREKRKGVYLR